MSVSYELEPNSGLIRTRCTGNVGLSDVFEHFATLAGDASLPPRLDVLLDLLESGTVPDSGQLMAIADRMKEMETYLRWGAGAIVARQEMLLGLGTMFELFGKSLFRTFSQFQDVAAAEAWLDSVRSDD